jgi:hypothetical protein
MDIEKISKFIKKWTPCYLQMAEEKTVLGRPLRAVPRKGYTARKTDANDNKAVKG